MPNGRGRCESGHGCMPGMRGASRRATARARGARRRAPRRAEARRRRTLARALRCAGTGGSVRAWGAGVRSAGGPGRVRARLAAGARARPRNLTGRGARDPAAAGRAGRRAAAPVKLGPWAVKAVCPLPSAVFRPCLASKKPHILEAGLGTPSRAASHLEAGLRRPQPTRHLASLTPWRWGWTRRSRTGRGGRWCRSHRRRSPR
jgi:hypothetical protein